MRFIVASVFLGLMVIVGKPCLAPAQESRINDASKVLGRVDIERISYALQTLEETASIEGSVQLLNKIEDEYPRPVTARDLAVYILVPQQTVTLRFGSELKSIFPEERANQLIEEKMKASLNQKNFGDAVVDVLNEVTKISRAEGGIKDQQQTENGKALALVIGICSATVLMFLWMLLFMNRFIGANVSLTPFLVRIIGAHVVAVLGLVAAYIVEIKMGLGIVGMGLIPVIVILQMLMLFKVFRTLLPAIGRN